MRPASQSQVHLFAVVPAEEAAALAAGPGGVSLLECGPVAALCGPPLDGGSEVHPALWHHRVVSWAFDACSSVVPFRLGIELGSAAELRAVLDLNVRELAAELGRFQGRAEMGFKARLGTATADAPLRLPFGLRQLRDLAPEPVDRRERVGHSTTGRVFEGCYLISRSAVEVFWHAVDDIRLCFPELPLLGSGPWAAYSFCDVPLRREPSQSMMERT